MSDRKCHVCHGKRLRPEVLAVTVGGKSIADVVEMSIKDSYQFFLNLELTDREQFIAKEVLKKSDKDLNSLSMLGLTIYQWHVHQVHCLVVKLKESD